MLLHEARRADYAHQAKELTEAEAALRELFGIDGAEAAELMKEGRAKAESLSSFYAPLTVIERDFSMPERIRLIEHLWRISFADGQLNLYEDHYVRKIAHLLYVPNTDRHARPQPGEGALELLAQHLGHALGRRPGRKEDPESSLPVEEERVGGVVDAVAAAGHGHFLEEDLERRRHPFDLVFRARERNETRVESGGVLAQHCG